MTGCGFLLSPKRVLTSKKCIKDEDDLKKYESVMYYNASEKEELFLAVNDKFAPIKIGSTKTVIFELSKGAEDFSPVFGKSRPEFSSKNSLELLSASQKNPGLSVLQLENVE